MVTRASSLLRAPGPRKRGLPTMTHQRTSVPEMPSQPGAGSSLPRPEVSFASYLPADVDERTRGRGEPAQVVHLTPGSASAGRL